jgi:hypothetical protein
MSFTLDHIMERKDILRTEYPLIKDTPPVAPEQANPVIEPPIKREPKPRKSAQPPLNKKPSLSR